MTNMLTIKQAAEQLNVHWKTVYSHVVSGKLTAYRVGRQWRIKQEDIVRYLEGNK